MNANASHGMAWLVIGLGLLSGCAADATAEEDDAVEQTDEADSALSGACPKKATAGRYVLCVTTSKTKSEWLEVYDRDGERVLRAEVTTSQIDRGDDDSLTCKGRKQLWMFQKETKSGLENYFGFGTSSSCQNQGVHYYPYVGASYDSHGCVRVDRSTSTWLAENVAPALKTGRIYLHIE